MYMYCVVSRDSFIYSIMATKYNQIEEQNLHKLMDICSSAHVQKLYKGLR